MVTRPSLAGKSIGSRPVRKTKVITMEEEEIEIKYRVTDKSYSLKMQVIIQEKELEGFVLMNSEFNSILNPLEHKYILTLHFKKNLS